MLCDDDDFDIYAIRNYQNPNCVSVLEFLDDLNRIKYVKRLLNKYVDRGELRERLILNHIIFLSNVFGIEATVAMLRYKVEDEIHPVLNSFLMFLRYCDLNDPAPVDDNLLEILKKTV
jgi:hypothetical protein